MRREIHSDEIKNGGTVLTLIHDTTVNKLTKQSCIYKLQVTGVNDDGQIFRLPPSSFKMRKFFKK